MVASCWDYNHFRIWELEPEKMKYVYEKKKIHFHI